MKQCFNNNVKSTKKERKFNGNYFGTKVHTKMFEKMSKIENNLFLLLTLLLLLVGRLDLV